jgi:tetratricopeptide (TPR) repeat protein
MLAQQSSTMKRYPNSVENFCCILENQPSITDDEQQMLRGLINLSFTFDDINSEECIKLFQGIRNERIVLILSKTSMKNLAKPIREEPFLSAIYVIDSSKENSVDSNLYRGSFPNIARLCKQLEKDLPLLAYDLTLISSIPAEYAKMSTFNYVQVLKDILLETNEQGNLKKEMIDFCREKYAGNTFQLKLINEFENTFQPDNAIEWYSRHEAFVYKMLTRAFRILDVDILYKLRYLIQHLHRQLQASSDTSPLTVYRTLRVRKDLFEKMKSYQDGLLSFNEFLLVSKNQPTTEPFPMNMDSKLVHFQINLEAGVPRRVTAKKPNEIILTVGTVFCIKKVESIDEETFTVKLTTNDDILKGGQLISKDLRDAVRSPFPLVRMLKLMRQRELTDYTEYFASIQINDPQTAADEAANLTLGGVLHNLGGHCYEKKQNEQGLIHLQNALKVYLRVLSPDDNKLTPTYNNIGSIYFRQDLNEKALEYHRKAYEIQKNSSSPDVESVAAYVGNIAAVLEKLGRHKEAIKYFEIDLKIQQKLHSKKDNPEIAVKHHNLASRQYRAQLYSEALENYQKCLEIELKCHSAENSTVALTYSNLATALDKLGRFQDAKAAVEKAVERLLRSKKEDDKDVQVTRRYLQQLEQKIWMKDLLAST